jgi:hypothetical protein
VAAEAGERHVDDVHGREQRVDRRQPDVERVVLGQRPRPELVEVGGRSRCCGTVQAGFVEIVSMDRYWRSIMA